MCTVQRAYKFIHRKITHAVHSSNVDYWKKRTGLLYLISNAFILTCEHMIEGCLNIWGSRSHGRSSQHNWCIYSSFKGDLFNTFMDTVFNQLVKCRTATGKSCRNESRVRLKIKYIYMVRYMRIIDDWRTEQNSAVEWIAVRMIYQRR